MDEQIKIVIPDTQVQIGINADEHPVYIDTKDLVLTGEEQAELRDNREKALLDGADERLADTLLEMFDAFVADTIMSTCPKAYVAKGDAAVKAWARENDINWFLDEGENRITCIVRQGDKTLRTMPIKFRRPTKGEDKEEHAVTA